MNSWLRRGYEVDGRKQDSRQREGQGQAGATLRNYLSLVKNSRETEDGQDRVNNQAHRDLSYSRSGGDWRDRGVNFKQGESVAL